MILDQIVEKRLLKIEEEFKGVGMGTMKQRLTMTKVSPALDVVSALRRKDGQIAVIAEIKPASPSAGIIKEKINPAEIALEYIKGGVDMISVLTEETFFKGSNENLMKVRQKVPVPILRKDFILDIRQIYQSRMLGADAILLIATILDDEKLMKLQIVAKILGMTSIVEVHDEEELKRVIELGADVIGINNRNLKTFEVNLETTANLIKLIPRSKIVVSESGIKNSEDVKYLKELGVDAVLIGETLMRAEDKAKKIKELRGENL